MRKRVRIVTPKAMILEDFKAVADTSELSLPLQALSADRQGDWDRAHTLAQAANNRDGDWVHAYLHRKDGDIGNAGYWYGRAGQERVGAEASLEAEWNAMATELLGRAS